jgi:hypothetical protein
MVLIISFDAVGDKIFERLLTKPNFAAFASQCTVARGADTVFLSNTYPVHSSVVTGVTVDKHGLISNTTAFPSGDHPPWLYHAKLLRAKTLWQAAAEKGLRTAAVLWPVTGGAKEIQYNIPELAIQKGQNQVVENLREGSKLLQIGSILKYRKYLNGTQPDRDKFVTACSVDILKKHKPDLALIHFSAYDALCHIHGEDFDQLEPALQVMDDGLGALLNAAGENAQVILFSDHAQLNVHHCTTPNDILVNMGLLVKLDGGGGYAKPADNPEPPFIECCGGSAFLYPGNTQPAILAEIRRRLETSEGFARFLTPEEIRISGRGLGSLPPGEQSPGGQASEGQNPRVQTPVGFCCLPGYTLENTPNEHKGQHGYPLDYDQYKVFYMARGRGIPRGKTVTGGSLLDIAPLTLAMFAAEGYTLDMGGLPPARGDFYGG